MPLSSDFFKLDDTNSYPCIPCHGTPGEPFGGVVSDDQSWTRNGKEKSR